MNRFRTALIAVLVVFAAVACGKTEDKKVATQIAAQGEQARDFRPSNQ